MTTTPHPEDMPSSGQFRKKPVVITASQWFKNGDHPEDCTRMITPVPGDGAPFLSEGKVVRYYRRPDVPGSSACEVCGKPHHDHGWIDTLEQGHRVCPGDWIITGVKGDRYPCKPDIFAATYEPATPTAITAEEAGREGEAKDAWISVNDRVPAVGQEVLVFGQSPWEKAPSIKVDLWDEIHEAPVSFSSATVSVGEGWTENDSEDDITHWRELPPAPAQSGGQGNG